MRATGQRACAGETGYRLPTSFASYLLSHYLDSEQRTASNYAPSSLGVANQPDPAGQKQEERQIALASGQRRVAAYYGRAAQQQCSPPQQRRGPNDVTPLLAMLEHLCLGWQWQTAYDQLHALQLDTDLLRWGMWHTLIRLYELMLPPVGLLNQRAEGLARCMLGTTYGKLGDYEQSRAYFTGALAIQREMGDGQSEALTLTNQGEILRVQGDQAGALHYFEQALALVQGQAKPELAAVLTHNMALLAQQQGDFQQSLRGFLQALQLARQSQDREREGLILTNIGLLLCQQQRYQEGLALLVPALQMRHAVHDSSASSLLAFLHKLEQSMGNETFTTLRQNAESAEQPEQVLRALAQL